METQTPPPDFSIIIPARNEEVALPGCLESIRAAQAFHPCSVEIIVVLNRCTDATEVIAQKAGARCVHEDSKNLSKIRNAGAAQATGKTLVTIDADSRMSPNMLAEIARALDSGRFIGGGVPIRPERLSAGIRMSVLLLGCIFLPLGISAGLFWCRREDFIAIGGFNENKVVAEDVDLALRLKAYGRRHGKRFGTLWPTHIVTSCRKFDRFGDWFMIRMLLGKPRLFLELFTGRDQEVGNKIFYDFKR